MLAKKKLKKRDKNYIQMNEQKEADKSSGFLHPGSNSRESWHASKSSSETSLNLTHPLQRLR